MKGKVALVIIFNHRFDRNIEVLEKVYQNRFSHIYFLVPFYTGNKPNVIAVYENSFYFQGYITQGFSRYFREEFEHYFFVADDMVINPEVNEENYAAFFGVSDNAGFIPEVFTLDNFSNNNTLLFSPYISFKDRLISKIFGKRVKPVKNLWWRIRQGFSYDPKKEGVEGIKEIPSYEKAMELIQRHGFQVQPLQYIDLHGGCPLPITPGKAKQFISYVFHQKLRNSKYPLKYPLVASYSDIVIVPAKSIKTFVHYCGVFAATELFVEFAIPTALLLTVDKVVNEPEIPKRGLVYWVYTDAQKEQYERDMNKFGYKLENLINHFPKETLYIHPIKLSKWKTEKT